MDGRNTRGMRTCVHISNHNQTPAEEKKMDTVHQDDIQLSTYIPPLQDPLLLFFF